MLIIDGKKIIPAPLVNFTKSLTNTGDGRPLSAVFNIALNGTILANRGSPTSSGVFHTDTGYPNNEANVTPDQKFHSILAKQEALRDLFVQPGLLLEYAPDDGSQAVKARIKLDSINFEPGTWVDLCRYTITLSAEEVNLEGTPADGGFGEFETYYLQSANESINVTESEDGSNSTSVTQSISAVGKSIYENPSEFLNGNEPWENAKTWVLTRLSNPLITYLVDTTGRNRYNTKRSEAIDTLSGSYSLSISYTITEDNADYVHNYEISSTTNRSQQNDLDDGQQLVESINVNGTIVGLSVDNNSQAERLAAAELAYATIDLTIPTTLGLNSDHLYVTKTIGKSLQNGSLTYSLQYTNYPDSQQYSHIYTVSDTNNSGGIPQATINGSIKYSSEDGNFTTIFDNAQSTWATIKNSIRATIMSVVDNDLIGEPNGVTINYNRPLGQIDYSATYNYTNEDNSEASNYFDQYEVTLNDSNTIDGSVTKRGTVSIGGSIVGLEFGGSSDAKYANALGRWNSIKSTIRNRCGAILANVNDVANRILSRSESHNKVSGTITYTHTYSLRTDIANEGIISEDIQIDTAFAKDVFAIHIIPGLASGPIIQNINTVTEESLTLSVNFLLDEGVATSVAETRFSELETLYAPATPNKYVSNNNRNYNPNTGAYSRTKSWTYKG